MAIRIINMSPVIRQMRKNRSYQPKNITLCCWHITIPHKELKMAVKYTSCNSYQRSYKLTFNTECLSYER